MSLQERISALESDLLAVPIRIGAYHDLPFAIFRYDPSDEYAARNEMVLLARRLENHGRRVTWFSAGRALWKAIQETIGLEAVVQDEQSRGFGSAQKTIRTLLADPDFLPLAGQLETVARKLDPRKDLIFVVRTAALAPSIYRCAVLLDEMHRRTMVPIVLFYPGSLDGTVTLRFMNLPDLDDSGAYNYRVRIY